MIATKFFKLLVGTALVISAASNIASAAPVLVGNATLNATNDLTVIADGSTTYQFLDLSTTAGISQSSALAQYSASGFSLATSVDVTRLFSSFGFNYTNSTSTVFNPIAATAAQENAFVGYFGATYGLQASLGSFYDVSLGQSYFCVSSSGCNPTTFVRNFDISAGDPIVGVVLVRTVDDAAADVPEPASLALLVLGLAGVAVARRRKS